MNDKIVLAYAKDRYQRGAVPQDGIGLVSKAFLESLEIVFPKHEIIYLDFSDYASLRGIKGVERIFTISAFIDKFRTISRTSEINLISVNEHALMRRSVKKYSQLRSIPSSYLEPHDGIRSNLQETKGVSNVIAFGSWNTYKSYELMGFDPQRIYAIGWKYWDLTISTKIMGKRRTILCFLGAICVRKGVYELESLVQSLKAIDSEFQINLVGFVVNPDLREWIISLERSYPKNFRWTNERIYYGDSEWKGLRDEVAFAIFPSWEEGLSGCLMDAINLGIPVVHSDRAGIEHSHEFLTKFDFFSSGWVDLVQEMISRGPCFWDEISMFQKRAAFFQYSNNFGIKNALSRLANGTLWPKIRITKGLLSEYEFVEARKSFPLDFVKPEFEYKKGSSPITHSIDLTFINRSFAEFSIIDKFRVATMVLDRYSLFNSLHFSASSDECYSVTKVDKIMSSQDMTPEILQLWVKAYHHGHQMNVISRFLFNLSESIYDFFYLNFSYRPKRYKNSARLKLKKELASRKSVSQRQER